MKFLLAVAVLAATAAYASDARFERTLQTNSSPGVNLVTGVGNIHLSPGSDNQVHIVGHVHANAGSGGSSFFAGLLGKSETDDEARIKQIASNPPIAQNGNEILIGDRHPDDKLYHNLSIDYDITLPRSSNIEIANGVGNLEIQEVGAGLRAKTGVGNIRLSGVRGEVSLDTGVGSIELEFGNTTGFNIDASTGVGSVNIKQTVTTTVNSGFVGHSVKGTVNGGGPMVRVHTGVGDVKVR